MKNKSEAVRRINKQFVCKICSKGYSQNSGIWHHMQIKHNGYSNQNVITQGKKIDKAKRGRPRNQDSQFPSKISSKVQKIEKIEYQDFDLEFLINEHAKLLFSVITEVGEPYRQSKENKFFHSYTLMESNNRKDSYDEYLKSQPFPWCKQNNNDQCEKPSQSTRNEQKSQLIIEKLDKFVRRMLIEMKSQPRIEFTKLFTKYFNLLREGNFIQKDDQYIIQELQKELTANKQNYTLLTTAIVESIKEKQLQIQEIKQSSIQKQGDQQGSRAKLLSSKIITQEKFLIYFVNSVQGYVFDKTSDYFVEYFGE